MQNKVNKIKVLQVCVSLDSEFGGPPKAITEIAKSLSDKDLSVSIFSIGNTKKFIEKMPWNISQLSEVRFFLTKSLFLNKYGFGGISVLLKEFLLNRPRIVIFHQIYTIPNILTFNICRFFQIPYVIMPHGSLEPYHEKFHPLRKKFLRFLVVNSFIRNAEQIFVAHQSEKEHLESDLQRKTTVVGLGININNETPPKVFLDNKMNFLFAGRLTEKKRIDLIIKSFFEYKVQNPDTKMTLKIAGSGSTERFVALKELISELSLNDSVFLLGWQDRKSLDDLFSEADVYIHISENENFSVSVAEALNFKVPIILSREVALSALVESHGAGLVVDQLDVGSIVSAMANLSAVTLKSFSSGAFEASKELDWVKVGSVWATKILQIVNK